MAILLVFWTTSLTSTKHLKYCLRRTKGTVDTNLLVSSPWAFAKLGKYLEEIDLSNICSLTNHQYKLRDSMY